MPPHSLAFHASRSSVHERRIHTLIAASPRPHPPWSRCSCGCCAAAPTCRSHQAGASAAPSRGERRTWRTRHQAQDGPLAPLTAPRQPRTTRGWRATRSQTAPGAATTPFQPSVRDVVGNVRSHSLL
eukprot:scaffold49781_cov63-Phaeocystis_antarctica.AAC.6